jgi:hypothetical protein
MSWLFWSVILLLVFALARWGGRTLSRHYGDGSEVGAALTVALGTVVAAGLIDSTGAPSTVVVPLVAVSLATGLIVGYGPRPHGGGRRGT